MARQTKYNLIPFFLLLIYVVLWELIVRILHIDKWILPSPSQTIIALWESRQLLLQHTFVTLVESFVGLMSGITVAFVVSILIYSFSFFKKSLYPLLIISQTIPFIALAPLLVVWFGFGILPKIIIVALVCFFPIAVNLIDGFTSIDQSIISNLQLLGANRPQIFRYAVLPASLPFFFSGLRIAGSYALLTAVVSEWIGASSGLGVFMIRASKSYATDRVFASILVISFMSLISITIINYCNKLAIPWKTIKH